MECKCINYADYFLRAQQYLADREVDYRISGRDDLPAARRNYKDTVFRMLFNEKTALLSLYNAVNKTNFTNEEHLEITTLENAIYLGMKNDVSCVFAFELCIYEHQSTVNPNMPLRDLLYVAQQLQKLVPQDRLYRSKPVKIPTPRFVVFYNGTTNIPERKKYCLSDLFEKPTEKPELELTVTVYNINPGMNKELLEACKLLKEYVQFTEKIRENRKTMDLKVAVNKAVDDCIKEGILEEFLRKQRAEVVAMSIYEYDQEKHLEVVKEESWEDGHAEGRIEGRAETLLEIYHTLISQGYSKEKALAIVPLTEEQLRSYSPTSEI